MESTENTWGNIYRIHTADTSIQHFILYSANFTWLRNGDFGIANENLQSSLASLCSALFQLNGNGAIIIFHYTAERKPFRLETKMCYFPGREENQHFSRKWICIWCLWSVKLTKKIKRTFILLGGRGLKDISIPTSVCWQISLLQYMAWCKPGICGVCLESEDYLS